MRPDDGLGSLSSDDLEEEVKVIVPEVLSPSKFFMPLGLSSYWEEAVTTCQMVSIAIVLPSGVTNFEVNVVDDGDVLCLSVDWPKPLVDIEFMHRKWLKKDASGKQISTNITRHHPKLLGFQKTLRMFRKTMENTPQSIARFGLPFTVQPNIVNHYNLSWTDDKTLMVLVDLRSVDDSYKVKEKKTDFEIH